MSAHNVWFKEVKKGEVVYGLGGVGAVIYEAML